MASRSIIDRRGWSTPHLTNLVPGLLGSVVNTSEDLSYHLSWCRGCRYVSKASIYILRYL